MNVILISPRRMGKTSLVKKVKAEISDPHIRIVMMDIYDCRSEYDFYNRFAASILKEPSNKMEQTLENVKKLLHVIGYQPRKLHSRRDSQPARSDSQRKRNPYSHLYR